MQSEMKTRSLTVIQSCLTFCDPMDIQSMEFSRPEYWSREPFPSPGDLPNPGIKPGSPALQVDSLPAKPQGKPQTLASCRLSSVTLTRAILWGKQHKIKLMGKNGS